MLSRLVIITLLLFLAPAVVRADATDDAVRRIGLQLQCPVCEGQTVAESNSGLAQDMRGVIRSRIEAGDSDQQVLDGFVASYGDGILTEPPKRGIGLGVWLGSLLGIGLGTALLVLILMGWRRAPVRAALEESIDAEVADEFGRFRNEFGR